MVKIKEQGNGMYFVQVKDPGGVRKQILETLRQIFEMLRRFEKLKQLRHEKLEHINKLRSLFKDANKLLGTLKVKLPQTSLKATVIKEQVHSKKHHAKNRKAPKDMKEKPEAAPKKELSDAEKLEAQLNAIESKLKNLT